MSFLYKVDIMHKGLWDREIGENWKKKKVAKVQQETVKTCPYVRKFFKKCVFWANMYFFEKSIFLCEKVVVILQWIWRENLRLRARNLNYLNQQKAIFDMVGKIC